MSPRNDPSGAAAAAARQGTLDFRSAPQFYGPYGPHVNRPHAPQPVSQTVPALTEADVSLWPDWTVISVEALDLDAFGDDGGQIRPEGGEE